MQQSQTNSDTDSKLPVKFQGPDSPNPLKLRGILSIVSRQKPIGRFRVAVNLVMKARLSTKFFIRKEVLFAYK